MPSATPRSVLQLVKSKKIEFVDLWFCDFPGQMQHVTFSAGELNERSFVDGLGCDGSSVHGWQAINEGDMLLLPVAHTAVIDPFLERPTLNMLCDIKDPVTRKNYSRDPRSVARKAVEYLKSSGIADAAYFGPEVEFFVFDNVRYDQAINHAEYFVDSSEGVWNRGSGGPANLGGQIRRKEGCFPCPPTDTLADVRSEMARLLMELGIVVESHHHEVATGGQVEIDLRHQELLTIADAMVRLKYVARSVAARHGKAATFMPKPLLGDNGSGMHTHFSLWKGGKNLMYGKRYAGLSEAALFAVGGILRHAPSLLALTNPTTNSYKRLVPGFEAPVNLVYSSRNRAAAVRVPVYQDNPATKRLDCDSPTRRATRTWHSRRCSWRRSTASATASTPARPSTRTRPTSNPRKPRPSPAPRRT
jgi:glutamine synthetase